MTSGPTQNYADPRLDRWRPHPILAWGLRASVYLAPPLLAVALGWSAARWFPASRLGLNPWVWLVAEVTLATAVVILVTRLTKRLLPLSTMLSMALVFPDRAPSRLSLAVRTHSPAALRRRAEEAQRTGTVAPDGEEAHAAELLGLVAALSLHDHATRGHSERVQGYASLLADELGLDDRDAARLRWAALLHDIGKLTVPAEILAKSGQPTEAEWKVLATHPHAGLDLAAPLADFLGDWMDAISQHHERWDGAGYPLGLARDEIHRGARIIAVADTYDVITSARSYKTAMPASQARAELARCSGTQFDPEVVRAFLAIGLGRLRLNAGPLSAITGLPGIRSIPLPDLGSAASGISTVLTSGSAVATAALGLLVGAIAAPAAALGIVPEPAAAAVDAGPAGAPAEGDANRPTTAKPTDLPADDPLEAADDDPPDATTSTPAAPGTDATAGPVTTTKTASTAAPGATPAASTTPSVSCTQVEASERDQCTLAGATLVGDWSGVRLDGEDLTGALLDGTNLSGAQLNGASLAGATLRGARLDGASLQGADLTKVVLDGVDLSGAKLTNATLAGARVAGAVSGQAVLRDATLLDRIAHDTAVLVGADLGEADLTGAQLSGADLTHADLSGAELAGSDLTGAWLTGATLSRTDLAGALLVGADVDRADLTRAVLDRANLWVATGAPSTLTKTSFASTVCPSGDQSSTSCW
ncbi:pentapeptide repeat-containing protein [Actinotalea sp. M2MS4P-6]|uniref:HD domain-containing phosphohydrolase n=1 Tax=Actinotalea sp. M2MS4P-6 TaxID=2983762 RepID=UPI0021E5099B|nr:HD domain-containing phosphohydrolase [Actinotalea sp. M2MS4P-6]MCV2393580.1 pentapeptide repeat-containing protein [Actinotalea sp. M2MS4P-6]